MVDELRQILEQAEQLEPPLQQILAARIREILQELEEHAWEQALNSPEGQARLDRLVAEADEEIASGKVEV